MVPFLELFANNHPLDMKKRSFGIRGLLVLSTALSVAASDWPQWRGPQRNGISRETGLLKEWPKDGPKLLWKVSSAGRGYSTPAVVGDRLYLLGNEGSDNEFVQALSVKDGHRVWGQPLGRGENPQNRPNFPAAAPPPTSKGRFFLAPGPVAALPVVGSTRG